MGRLARAVVPGYPHHITQRGNQQQDVFFSDADRRLYLDLARENCGKYGVRVLAWCLMSNHVHAVAIPAAEESLAKAFGRTHNDYARWMHVRQQQNGHLWQNRYHSCVLDQAHLMEALRYVELNPVRAGFVVRPWEWEWSSARAHVTGVDRERLLDMQWWRQWYDERRWKLVLEEGHREAAHLERLREATRNGRPCGDEGFVAEIEIKLDRCLARQRRGPKRRSEPLAGQMSLVIS